jgi:hypothetical protein
MCISNRHYVYWCLEQGTYESEQHKNIHHAENTAQQIEIARTHTRAAIDFEQCY